MYRSYEPPSESQFRMHCRSRPDSLILGYCFASRCAAPTLEGKLQYRTGATHICLHASPVFGGHLSRQKGGIGMRGDGETQLELTADACRTGSPESRTNSRCSAVTHHPTAGRQRSLCAGLHRGLYQRRNIHAPEHPHGREHPMKTKYLRRWTPRPAPLADESKCFCSPDTVGFHPQTASWSGRSVPKPPSKKLCRPNCFST